jgi:hypothetical protein
MVDGQPPPADASVDGAASAPMDATAMDATVPVDGGTMDATTTQGADADGGRDLRDANGAGLADADGSDESDVALPVPALACNVPEPAAPLAVGATDVALPAWLGGTIASGTYVATSITAYSPLAAQEGIQPCVSDLLKGTVWSFQAGANPSSGTITAVSTLVGNGLIILMPVFSGTYATSGSSLAIFPTCASCFSGTTIADAVRCAACEGSDAAACSNCYSACSVGTVSSDAGSGADGGGAAGFPYTVTSTGLIVGEPLAAGCGSEVLEFGRQLADGGLEGAQADGSADAGGDGAPGSACRAECEGGPSCVVSPPCDGGCGSGEWCGQGDNACFPGLFAFPASAMTASLGVPFTADLGSIADLDTQDSPDALVVAIDWGDGTSSGGHLTGTSGNFRVSGTHTYSAAGTVTLTWSASSPCTGVTATATISVVVD